jgi:protein tyrosine phosphatase
MRKIKNVSLFEYEKGGFSDFDIGIRIVDDMSLISKRNILPIEFTFVFSDVNEDEKLFMSEKDANLINVILQGNEDANVLVHCIAGVSRSGAVAQFAVDFLNYEDAGFSGDAGFGREYKNADMYKLLRKVSGFRHSFEC